MKRFKICLLGDAGVGKTSLVNRFVNSIFSNSYHSTVGTKVDRKLLVLEDEEIELILWDFAGGLENRRLFDIYLRGTSGSIFVGDGTRPKSIDLSMEHLKLVRDKLGDIPSIFLLNKSDLSDAWKVDEDQSSISEHFTRDSVFRTSAKTGENVELTFATLTRRILEKNNEKREFSGDGVRVRPAGEIGSFREDSRVR